MCRRPLLRSAVCCAALAFGCATPVATTTSSAEAEPTSQALVVDAGPPSASLDDDVALDPAPAPCDDVQVVTNAAGEVGLLLRQGQTACFGLGSDRPGLSPFDAVLLPHVFDVVDENTVVATLSYDPELRSALTVTSPYRKWQLHAKAVVSLADVDGWHRTTTCPVVPLAAGMEIWPDEIDAVVLFGFRFLPEDDTSGCR